MDLPTAKVIGSGTLLLLNSLSMVRVSGLRARRAP
jgi:hypothetical protein